MEKTSGVMTGKIHKDTSSTDTSARIHLHGYICTDTVNTVTSGMGTYTRCSARSNIRRNIRHNIRHSIT